MKKVLKWFGMIVGGIFALLVVLIIVAIIFDQNDPGDESSAEAPSTPVCAAQVESANFDFLSRYPEQAQGTCYLFKGKIIQRLPASDGVHTFRVSVTPGTHDTWDDPVLVEGTDRCMTDGGAGKALEDDIVSFRGRSHGDTTYESIFGATIEIPLVTCE